MHRCACNALCPFQQAMVAKDRVDKLARGRTGDERVEVAVTQLWELSELLNSLAVRDPHA